MTSARKLAFSSLRASFQEGKYANLELDAALKEKSLSPEDKALYARLYLGVIEKKITLDYLLSQVSTLPLNQIKEDVLCLLELGAYQILFMDRIPDRAAIFETVELGKQVSKNAVPYLNAVLRKLSSEKDQIHLRLNLPGKKGLSLRYGYPRWMVGLWQDAYGKERCVDILEAQNTPAPLTLRVNTLKTTKDAYLALLGKAHIPYHDSALSKNGIVIEHSLPPSHLPGYEDGLFFIQDGAAQHAVEKLCAQPGDTVLDLCASPGGKSFGAAMDMNGKGEILALEYHKSRLPLIENGARRLGISMLSAAQNDSTIPKAEHFSRFDCVICDVPCSGLGTIAKKPDIRLKNKEELASLTPTQKAILETGALATKAGGRLLYSTCTLNPEENEAITDDFLSRHPEFTRVGEAETIFPVGGENDGFFCDLLEKKQ